MENYDPQAAARVWQRVLGSAPVPETAPDMTALIAGTMTDAALMTALWKHAKSPHREILEKMIRQARSDAACLRGICRVRTGAVPQVQISPPQVFQWEPALRQCYSRKIQRASRYTELSADPEFGEIYRALAAGEQSHCRQILQLLGHAG